MGIEITSRERVLNAIERKPNDRTPYNFRAEAEVYQAVKNRYGLSTDEEVRLWARSDFRNIGAILSEGGYGTFTGFGWRERCSPPSRFSAWPISATGGQR